MAKTENQLYKPADACRMAEVAPYVLRYWETEFSALSEGKEKGSSRLYTARDVQIIARIRQLLYDEGFTVAGAKKRLEAEIQEGRFDNGDQPAPKAPAKQKLEDVEIAPSPLVKPPAPVAKPTPAPAPAPRTPPPAPAPVVSAAPAPAPAARDASSFPERKTVIRELKEIVRLLEKPRKR